MVLRIAEGASLSLELFDYVSLSHSAAEYQLIRCPQAVKG